MPTPPTKVILGDDLISALRRRLDLPADTPTSQVIRAALLRFLGHEDADGSDVNRGGRPKLTQSGR